MATALREFTLLGSRFAHGSTIPESIWGQCGKRTQVVLERNRFVTHKTLQKAVAAPVATGLDCWCGKAFSSKQALGGHQRGHTKRGEAPQEG